MYIFRCPSNPGASNSLNLRGSGEGPLAFLGHPVGTVECFANILAILRIFLVIFDSFRIFWNLLNFFGTVGFFWNVLDSFGMESFESIGIF